MYPWYDSVQIKEHHGIGNVTIQWEKLNGSELQNDLSRVIIIVSHIIYFCYCMYLCDECCVINVSVIQFQDVGKAAEICKLHHTVSEWFAVLSAAWVILSSRFLNVCFLITWTITTFINMTVKHNNLLKLIIGCLYGS